MHSLAQPFALFASLALALAHPHSLHDHAERGSLLSSLGVSNWAHPADHPVRKLFERQGATDYPSFIPDSSTMPQAWKDALASATAAGLIPNIVQSNNGVYPSGVNAADPSICSSAFQCRAEGDIWDAPDGMLGVSFDDGPTANSPVLYDFLKSQNQRATHFFIGSSINNYQSTFTQAFEQGDDIAVHTYTHRWMSSLSNADLVAEFGWTMQIIFDLSGGRVARYWRPPYGDSDNRVRAIAKNIFGLTQVDWNQDTDDWELGNNGTTPQAVAAALQSFINGPKSPGLIILEHELYPGTVQAFIDAYPDMKAKGWDTRSIPDLFEDNAYYQNADDNTADVTPMNIIQSSAPTGTASNLPYTDATSSSSAAQTTSPVKAVVSASSPATATTHSSSSSSPSPTATKNFALPGSSPSQLLAAFSSCLLVFSLFL